MRKQAIFYTILLLIPALNLSAQVVELQAPPLSGRQAALYCFHGSKTDTIPAVIDASGKATFTISHEDSHEEMYRGMAQLVVPGAGRIEIVVAEPDVLVECSSAILNNETGVFPQSEENNYLKQMAAIGNRYIQQQSWLQAAPELFSDSRLLTPVKAKLAEVNDSMQTMDRELSASKLYAAKYYRLIGFLNRLYATVQRRDGEGAILVCKEMENSLDIASLYTSGQLWSSIMDYYFNLFNQTVNDSVKQKKYAESVLKTAKRLSNPYLEAYLAGSVTETGLYGWRDAEHKIIEGLLNQYKGFTSTEPKLQRAIDAYRVSDGEKLPPIVGLSENSEPYTKMLILFYDSDCGHCTTEIANLTQIYPKLKEKGIRVVSIAADMNKEKFEAVSQQFLWQDKLCDFKGFAGENFVNYNVVGFPSLYLTDTGGKYLGFYHSVADMEKDL